MKKSRYKVVTGVWNSKKVNWDTKTTYYESLKKAYAFLLRRRRGITRTFYKNVNGIFEVIFKIEFRS